jgi:general secretion pathway protein N
MNAAHQRQLTPVLVVIAVLFSVLLLLLLSGIGRSARWDPPRALAPLPAQGNPADLPQPKPLQQFALVWQKPLFSPDRKPMDHATDGGSSLGDLELSGIILTRQLRMALLHDKKGDTQVRVLEGATLPDSNIRLVEVRPRSAVFDAPSGRTELKLPAGAPIDTVKQGATPDRSARDASTGNPAMRVQPGAALRRILPRAQPSAQTPSQPLGQARQTAADRLRESIQKRRAARAAAANEGVR